MIFAMASDAATPPEVLNLVQEDEACRFLMLWLKSDMIRFGEMRAALLLPKAIAIFILALVFHSIF
ncbi:MAG TPA: hypothetical protein DEG17_17085 [Cyanobacteria bacterium UBA11149]|nr:hypothetical protein [Cyanobacteria bacterium UBA11367]HBE58039.1 hypothetical protein [Cyanobacteria bacterium UBA11366]HBK66256.1 hypothetical protein [Cyanobacteria bacterium UBA11166]HBR75340.1 hypothetical protein [Cyanobacteria bacterium UBA11159]HBS71945.1 hypothetical protein [Cyanobacteria bacterium UBA11153]HBW90537.1 hypothetical protein [Cyanobacteria bacterium UBA11149]HCA93926.1 hypothetical protein [Cyanobacteria bacterium UBA9226]